MLLLANWAYIACGNEHKVSRFGTVGNQTPGTKVTNLCCSGFTQGKPIDDGGGRNIQPVYGCVLTSPFTRKFVALSIDLAVIVGLVLFMRMGPGLTFPEGIRSIINIVAYSYCALTILGLLTLPIAKRCITWGPKWWLKDPSRENFCSLDALRNACTPK